ncbi:MAG: LPS export ABC transporter periplasmic protein LptC [Thiobacillaceae bacterium]|nr:LPS export ABC transporter periplasmic protein LptC [Thiobacillaceae bacterium]MCX7672994.1 LPS export ABC transporter periplasmic protein LptC [Thiobacillaceae bacterium]MDW8323457.1 LPS export ABC transporter periplasmic protein LptC [Burkholderiales bacterium]
MSTQPHSWLPLILAAALAALAWWLNQIASRPLTMSEAAFRHEPDLIIDRFAATAYDHQGYPRYVLSAEQLRYYPDDETTELTGPHFRMQARAAPSVQALAQRGLISPRGEHVHLLGQVQVIRAATAQTPELTMTTEYLHVTPEAQLLQTDKPVELRQGGTHLRADRMVLDGRARRLELAGGVKAVYAPR